MCSKRLTIPTLWPYLMSNIYILCSICINFLKQYYVQLCIGNTSLTQLHELHRHSSSAAPRPPSWNRSSRQQMTRCIYDTCLYCFKWIGLRRWNMHGKKLFHGKKIARNKRKCLLTYSLCWEICPKRTSS